MAEWYEVSPPHYVAPYSTFGSGLSGSFRTRNVVRPVVYALAAPITADQYANFGAQYAANGPYADALHAFGGWFHAMQTAIPQLASALSAAQDANLFNLITLSIAFNASSPWHDATYGITTLNGYLANPALLSNVEPLWVYWFSGNGVFRSRSNNWGCDTAGVAHDCIGLSGIAQCTCVLCCYDLHYGRLPESIPALDSWGDAAGIHVPAGTWQCPAGSSGCGNPVLDCDPNHPCNPGYSCVPIGSPPTGLTACIIVSASPPACNGVGTSCSSDASCCSGMVCSGGNCQIPSSTCQGQAECNLTQVCVGGYCVEVNPGNCLHPPQVCSNTIQCCPGLVCNVPPGTNGAGVCTDPSTLCGTIVCASGQHCSNNICVDNTVDPCANVSCGSGYHCDNGNCVPDNENCSAATCLAPNTCQNNVCTAPGQGCDATNCTSPNYCANGVCTTPPTCTTANCPPPNQCVGNVCTTPGGGGGSNGLVIVLGIVGLLGVGIAVAASEPQGSYY